MSLVDESHPPYLALSYVWGDPSVTTNLTVNGCVFKATTNLVAALRSLRSNWKKFSTPGPALGICQQIVGPFWIDAICIDQGNHEERSQQVQFMRRIYATATLVVAWLGEAQPEYLAGMEALNQIHDAHNPQVRDQDFSWLSETPSLWQWDLETREPNKVWKSIAQIFEPPYWKRTWVIQELVVCKDAWAVFGDLVLPIAAFLHFLIFLEEVKRSVRRPQPSPFSHIYAQIRRLGISVKFLSLLFEVRYFAEVKEPMRLSWLVSRFQQRLSTDPRDKIFGLLGIADTSIKADYSQSERDVYEEMALTWNENSDSPPLDFILYSGLSQVRQDAFWPSWIPDWQFPRLLVPAEIITKCAAPRPISTTSYQSRPIVEQQRLKLSGSVLDHIVATDRIDDEGETYGDGKRNLLRLMVEILQKHGKKYLMPMLRCLMWHDAAGDGDDKLLECFADLFQQVRSQSDGINIPPALEEAATKSVAGKTAFIDFHTVIGMQFWRRSICLTSKGDLVAAAPNAQVGDPVVVVVPGCSCLILLRRVESWYVHLGPCYVDGLTDIVVSKLLQDSETQMEEFEIR